MIVLPKLSTKQKLPMTLLVVPCSSNLYLRVKELRTLGGYFGPLPHPISHEANKYKSGFLAISSDLFV